MEDVTHFPRFDTPIVQGTFVTMQLWHGRVSWTLQRMRRRLQWRHACLARVRGLSGAEVS